MAKEGQNTETQILRAAEAEFVEKGYSGARTTSIASKAGVTHAMLHYYFRTKDALFDRILQEKVNMISGEIAAILENASGRDIRYKLSQVIRGHFNLLKNNPSLPLFLLNELKNNPEKLTVVKVGMGSFLAELIKRYQLELDESAQRGETAKNVRFVDLIIDILSLNIMSMLLADLIMPNINVDRNEYLQQREKEIELLIMKRLEP